MCWSGEASTAIAAAGFASGYYCWKRGESRMIWAPVTYFAGMEALQAYTYTVVDQCSLASNQVATTLGYFHIAFQPIFINAFSLSFVPAFVRNKIKNIVYAFAAIMGVLFLMRLMPLDWLRSCMDVSLKIIGCPSCAIPTPLCSDRLCAVSGSWHLAWELPLKFHPVLDNAYVAAAFLMPLLYGAWRITLYLFIAGPVLAAMTTDNPNEWPAIWCLFSTIILGIAVQPKLRKWVRCESWYGWKPKAIAEKTAAILPRALNLAAINTEGSSTEESQTKKQA